MLKVYLARTTNTLAGPSDKCASSGVFLQDYAIAAAISTGCAAFGLSGSVAAKAAAKHSGLHTSSAGVGLMVTYLVFDGFTSTWQVGIGISHWVSQGSSYKFESVVYRHDPQAYKLRGHKVPHITSTRCAIR